MIELICPHCRKPLNASEQQLNCINGHAFDKGKAGDVNLLLPQQKRSKSPGDSKAMIAARSAFLQSGAYQPIAEILAKYVTLLSQGEARVIVDAGCGEGYYLRRIAQLCYPNQAHFEAQGGALLGWDISKFAVQSAAKQSRTASIDANWLTASNVAIPVADHAIDILISAFGFEVATEFARVVKSGGYVITVDAGESHLLALREIIYPEIKPYREKAVLDAQLFRLVKTDGIFYQIKLNAVQIEQLMTMTPHLYRASHEGKSALAALAELTVDIDGVVRIYQAI